MNKKNLITLYIILMTSLCLTACSSNDSNSSSVESLTTEEITAIAEFNASLADQ